MKYYVRIYRLDVSNLIVEDSYINFSRQNRTNHSLERSQTIGLLAGASITQIEALLAMHFVHQYQMSSVITTPALGNPGHVGATKWHSTSRLCAGWGAIFKNFQT
ncbi:MAG TPA: hypothetical protein VE868_00635 [Balneolaceae bacterium]|nr:hypothetical protein [Balneolaceae bacterium]